MLGVGRRTARIQPMRSGEGPTSASYCRQHHHVRLITATLPPILSCNFFFWFHGLKTGVRRTEMAESKFCFVTTGATAPFKALIESVLSPSTLDTLRQTGFTRLRIQYGTAQDCYDQCLEVAKSHLQQTSAQGTIIIEGMDFDAQGLREPFKLVQQSKGLVVSHAGALIHHPI